MKVRIVITAEFEDEIDFESCRAALGSKLHFWSPAWDLEVNDFDESES